jgi:hypothetical protein
MNNGKKKSSGWRPHEKRFNRDKWKARHIATTDAKARAHCDGLGRSRRCPVRRCRRAQGCAGDPWRCQQPVRLPSPQQHSGDTRAAVAPEVVKRIPVANEAAKAAAPPPQSEQPRFAISAKDAAAAIAASIANFTPPDSLPDGELAAIVRDGRIHDGTRRG